jgi:hypothetical protein
MGFACIVKRSSTHFSSYAIRSSKDGIMPPAGESGFLEVSGGSISVDVLEQFCVSSLTVGVEVDLPIRHAFAVLDLARPLRATIVGFEELQIRFIER